MNLTLREKFEACIAGAQIGAAMGAVTKGMTWQTIQEKYDFVDTFFDYTAADQISRRAGTPGYDAERAKLIMAAIIDKGGCAFVEDVRAAWLKHGDLAAMSALGDVFEAQLAVLAKTDMPARDIGKYCDYSGLDTVPGAIYPIGLINAGDVESAAQNVFDVGQIYQISGTRSLQWAAVLGMAIACAAAPGTTMDDIFNPVLEHGSARWVGAELKLHLDGTKEIEDAAALRTYFDQFYGGYATPLSDQFANEIVTKAFCIFRMTKGSVREAVLTGVNIGRDTAGIAAIAGALAGVFGGMQDVPREWVEIVDAASLALPYTCLKHTIKESADLLYQAFRNKLDRQQAFIDEMDIA